MSNENNECWYEQSCVDQMNAYFDEKVKGKTIEELPYHISILKTQLGIVRKEIDGIPKLLDVGCGTASASVICKDFGFEYHGCDLDHIVNGCAKRNFPEYKYHEIDLAKGTPLWLYDYDVLLANGFIDILPNPLYKLEKILTFTRKYLILHRQEISFEKPTHVIESKGYGGKTFHSIINRADFDALLNDCGFIVVNRLFCDFAWESGGDSIILKNVKDY